MILIKPGKKRLKWMAFFMWQGHEPTKDADGFAIWQIDPVSGREHVECERCGWRAPWRYAAAEQIPRCTAL